MSKIEENILDVTVIEPNKKLTTIFQRYDELKSGMTLEIHNDHDPKPLYYQMKAELGDTFNWEYKEQGPVWWKVRLTKLDSSVVSETIGELAAEDPKKIQVFKKYGIDFYCGGQKTLKNVCLEQNLDFDTILRELQYYGNVDIKTELPYDQWDLDFLIDFIINTHHTYVKKNLPEIRNYANKATEVHGRNHPEILGVRTMVEKLSEELFPHLQKEEMVLFPRIKQLVQIKLSHDTKRGFVGFLHGPISVMIVEHESAGELLKEIRTITNNYQLPKVTQTSYGLLFRMLQEFENDLHTHIHLENNILFPKAEKLEASIFK